MKSQKAPIFCKILLLGICLAVLFPSCDREDIATPPPAYVGYWLETARTLKQVSSMMTIYFPMYRKVLCITPDSIMFLQQKQIVGSSIWSVDSGLKGIFTAKADVLTITFTHSGSLVSTPSDTVPVFKYTEIPIQNQQTITHKWSVVDDKLALFSDDNNDGVFDDTSTGNDSFIIYTKM